MSRFSWHGYWSRLDHGGHRSQSEQFLEKEAREKLYHLGPGDSLLDFGCGSADLLAYYAGHYRTVVGADFSPSMLKAAQGRISRFGWAGKVTLVEADDVTIWGKVSGTFDHIATGQVLQYFSEEMTGAFLGRALQRLGKDGRIVFFDVIDPSLFCLFELGLLDGSRHGFLDVAGRGLRLFCHKRLRQLRGLPPSETGRGHYRSSLARIAAQHGLQAEFVSSMFYSYRYHAIFTRNLTATER